MKKDSRCCLVGYTCVAASVRSSSPKNRVFYINIRTYTYIKSVIACVVVARTRCCCLGTFFLLFPTFKKKKAASYTTYVLEFALSPRFPPSAARAAAPSGKEERTYRIVYMCVLMHRHIDYNIIIPTLQFNPFFLSYTPFLPLLRTNFQENTACTFIFSSFFMLHYPFFFNPFFFLQNALFVVDALARANSDKLNKRYK